MALKWLEGFENYATATSVDIDAELLDKYTSLTQPTNRTATGRLFGFSLTGSNSRGFQTPVFTNHSTWIIGGAWKWNSFGSFSEVIHFKFGDDIELKLRLNTAGQLLLETNTVLATASFSLKTNSWYYIEIKATIDNTGSYEVRVGGQTVLSGSADTSTFGNEEANNFEFWQAQGGGGSMDDIYICDGSGTDNNDFLGDIQVAGLLPNGVGAFTDFGVTGAASNYLAVDEQAPDGDTSYVSTSTAGDKDTYLFSDLSTSLSISTVYGVQVNSKVRKDDVGSRTIRNIARQGTSETVGPTEFMSNDYVYHSNVVEKDPNTTSDWTEAGVNSAQFGVELIS